MNLDDILVDERRLAKRDALIDGVLASKAEYDRRSLEPRARRALGRHVLFSDADARSRAGFASLSELEAYYNSYFWFLIFAKLYQAQNGYDAGMEQQVFRIIEQMPPDGDWALMDKIAKLAEQN